MHFGALRFVGLRGGGRTEEILATENEREMGDVPMRRTCARALSLRSSLLLEHSYQPTPSPLSKLA